MSFDVPADAYQQFMGAYSDLLSPGFADFAGVHGGDHVVLDVGCGPGPLAAELVRRLSPRQVRAADPTPGFVAAARNRLPGVDVALAPAEQLPYADASFDVALAQLVVYFMTDARRGIQEMARVTRPGGVVAAAVWDMAGGRSPLSVFWEAAESLRPGDSDDIDRLGAKQGDLQWLLSTAGLIEIQQAELPVARTFPSFADWWRTFTYGVGPAGDYVHRLGDEETARLRRRCSELLPDGQITIHAVALAARGRTPAA